MLSKNNSNLIRMGWFLFIFIWPNHIWAQNRLISLKPNITEIVFALGAGNEVVGVTRFCDSPEAAGKIEKVGDYMHADVEKIIRLQPTVILNSEENSQAREMRFLEEQGLKVELFSFVRMSDIPDSIRRIGKVIGREDQAKILVQKYEAEMESLKNAAEAWRKERVLFVVDQKPLVVVGSSNWIGDLVDWLGLDSVSSGNPMKYPHYNLEQVVAARPTLIVNMSMGADQKKYELDEWASLPVIKDARKVPFDIRILRANHRLPEAGRVLLEELKRNPGGV